MSATLGSEAKSAQFTARFASSRLEYCPSGLRSAYSSARCMTPVGLPCNWRAIDWPRIGQNALRYMDWITARYTQPLVTLRPSVYVSGAVRACWIAVVTLPVGLSEIGHWIGFDLHHSTKSLKARWNPTA